MRWLWLLVLAGCAIGAPPGFSPGDTWTFPLVDPLAGGRLLVPMYVGTHGPYVMAIDPDSPITLIDPQVAVDADLRTTSGPRRVDEHDTSHPTFYTSLPNVRVGDLTISLLDVAIADPYTYDADGRRIYGVLGKDVIADSLVFSFDRDRGVAWLTTQQAFHAPAGAKTLHYDKAWHRVTGIPRRMVTTQIDGHAYQLHVDPGDVASQLRVKLWNAAGLQAMAFKGTLIDETGTHRDIAELGVAHRVIAGDIERDDLGFAEYDDRRFWEEQIDGTLGLDFFRPYSVSFDWHHTTLYLSPRGSMVDTRALRLSRWGWPAHCAHPGCLRVELVPQVLPYPADPRPMIRVTRDPELRGPVAAIVHVAAPEVGSPMPVEMVLPEGASTVSAQVDSRYTGGSVELVDASPFPRNCTDPHGCVIELQPPPP